MILFLYRRAFRWFADCKQHSGRGQPFGWPPNGIQTESRVRKTRNHLQMIWELRDDIRPIDLVIHTVGRVLLAKSFDTISWIAMSEILTQDLTIGSSLALSIRALCWFFLLDLSVSALHLISPLEISVSALYSIGSFRFSSGTISWPIGILTNFGA